jgi:hypothetical protein
LPAHDIEQAVIGAAVRALGNRALLIGRVDVSDASADQIRALLDSAGRIAAMVEKDSSPERARALRDRRAPVTAICLPGLRPRFVKQSR